MPRFGAGRGRVTAMLGPTNTGKTYHAIERLLAHRTGVIGLPLRLLAREVYDRVVARAGPDRVALVTGEERIVPPRTQYWVCTTEAMPREIGADFVCVDEIQLAADAERGHVFTDRLLHARGLKETLFLGSDTMRSAIAALVGNLEYIRRNRLSVLRYAGAKKLSRMPERSAIVAFSVESVYAIAELIRRQKGGCAVVMGALSPRTRNAQVALYQNGDVDYLVATDAIGMGLNLDIQHVAFAATAKFDGRRRRPLYPDEIGQIAGRAGRYRHDGTFGVTGDVAPFDPALVEAIETHSFRPVRRLMWRNTALDFSSADRLVRSLEEPTDNPWLFRTRDSDDLITLKELARRPEIIERLGDARRVALLWDVCRIPDFRKSGSRAHVDLLARIFVFLVGRGIGGGRIPSDWLGAAIRRIDRTDGNIDTLSRRLAYIRTWTYVVQRKGWVEDETGWREETRAVEDRLSDALHRRLTQRFVDRRTSVLLRRLKQKEDLVAEVDDNGGVTVEEQFVGRLDGFVFRQDARAGTDEARTLRQAALAALGAELHLRADRFYNAPDGELDFTDQGGLMWGTAAVGRLVKGAEVLKPDVVAFVDDEAPPEIAEKVARRLRHFVERKVAALFEPLLALAADEALMGLARGFAFRLVESLGVIPRAEVAQDVKALDQPARALLRRHRVRFGQYSVFIPALLKPAPTRLRLVLWALWHDLDEFPESPPPGLVTIPRLAGADAECHAQAGYHPAGDRAIRIDMLERLADLLRVEDARAGFEASQAMLSITGTTHEQFSHLMTGLGYQCRTGERPRAPAEPPAATTTPEAEVAAKVADATRSEANAGHAGDAAPPEKDSVEGEATTAATDATASSVSVRAEAPDTSPSPAVSASTVAEQEAGTNADDAAAVTSEAAPPEKDATPPAPETAEGGTSATPDAAPAEKDAEKDLVPAAPGATESAAAETPATSTGPDDQATMETFYIFTRAPRRRRPARRRDDAPGQRHAGGHAGGGRDAQAAGKRGQGPSRRGAKGKAGNHPRPDQAPRHSTRKPAEVDPDNPFAALLALRGKV